MQSEQLCNVWALSERQKTNSLGLQTWAHVQSFFMPSCRDIKKRLDIVFESKAQTQIKYIIEFTCSINQSNYHLTRNIFKGIYYKCLIRSSFLWRNSRNNECIYYCGCRHIKAQNLHKITFTFFSRLIIFDVSMINSLGFLSLI